MYFFLVPVEDYKPGCIVSEVDQPHVFVGLKYVRHARNLEKRSLYFKMYIPPLKIFTFRRSCAWSVSIYSYISSDRLPLWLQSYPLKPNLQVQIGWRRVLAYPPFLHDELSAAVVTAMIHTNEI